MARLVDIMCKRRWEEWKDLGGNPFMAVITRKNCVQMGLPDYFTLADPATGQPIVRNAMNLEWIKKKVQGKGPKAECGTGPYLA
jgi:hypothetical protein